MKFRDPNAHFATCVYPPCQGLWIFTSRYSSPLRQLKEFSVARRLEMTSLTNLCNRLIVTSTRWIPNSQVKGFTLLNHKATAQTSIIPYVQLDPFGSFALGGDTGNTVSTCCSHYYRPPWVVCVLQNSERALSAVFEPDNVTTDASCRTSPPFLAKVTSRTRTLFAR